MNENGPLRHVGKPIRSKTSRKTEEHDRTGERRLAAENGGRVAHTAPCVEELATVVAAHVKFSSVFCDPMMQSLDVTFKKNAIKIKLFFYMFEKTRH